jgi:diguanylate cyclase
MKATSIHEISSSLQASFDEVFGRKYTKQTSTVNRPKEQFQPDLSELDKANQALITCQQLLELAEQKNAEILANNENLKQKLFRLEKKYEQALHFANHDELTGLPNRSLLIERLKQAMAQSDRKHTHLAVLFIDLDKFKSVNDQLGHAAGDKLLQQVAGRLTASIRYGDTACRYGGDEFVILLPEIDVHENVAVVLEKLQVQLARPFELNGHTIEVRASIGSAVYSSGEKSCTDLIKEADSAMYFVKTQNSAESNLRLLRSSTPRS